MTLPPPSTTTTPLLPSSSPAPTPAPPRSPPPLVPSPLPAASPAGLSLFLALLDAHDQSMLVSWAESVLDRARRGKLAPKAYTAPPEAWQARRQRTHVRAYANTHGRTPDRPAGGLACNLSTLSQEK
eukprot:6201199-Pleurochrysis_carterae.AAC.1